MKRIILAFSLAALALPAMADVTTAVAGSSAGAISGSGAVAAGNNTPVTVNIPTPTRTEAEVKTVPSLGGMGGWAYAAPSGPCLGPSETKQGGAQATWLGFGGGGQYGQGQSNLDWGCVVLRDMAASQVMCDKGVAKACTDRNALYEMLPGVSAVRNGALPDYAKQQVVPAAPPAKRAEGPQQVAAVRQPSNCVSDPYIAGRTGAAVCK